MKRPFPEPGPGYPSDIFRKEYRPLSEDEKEFILEIKTRAVALEMLFNNSRYGALARTNLEQSVMWAIKGVTDAPKKAGA